MVKETTIAAFVSRICFDISSRNLLRSAMTCAARAPANAPASAPTSEVVKAELAKALRLSQSIQGSIQFKIAVAAVCIVQGVDIQANFPAPRRRVCAA